jgi:hypothetical protein
VNRSAVEIALVPPGVVTVTLTTPAAWAGDLIVILVLEFTVRLVPAVVPKLTAVAPVNPVPVMVTRVLPALGPLIGEILVTVGRAAYVNLSPATITLVPPGVVTLTSTIPAAWVGEVMVILVLEFTVRLVPGVVPNLTAVAPVNPVPVTVSRVPPAVGPLVGEIAVIVGAAPYVNLSAATIALVPPGVVTLTSTTPAIWAGEVMVILVLEFTVRLVPAVVPNLTAVAPVNPVPVIVTTVPPAVGPLAGEMAVTVGRAITVI